MKKSMRENKANAEVELKSKNKELELLKIKLKEKEQERRLVTLKLKEIKRIIKQHKLKPLIQNNLKHRGSSKSGRNKSMAVNQSHPGISKTYDMQYGGDQVIPQTQKKSKPFKLQLAKLEWKSKANINLLHESSADLRYKAPKDEDLESGSK